MPTRVVHPQHTLVADLMSHSVTAADPRDRLTEAAARMRTARVSALAVLDAQQIVGIITERDLMRALADGRAPAEAHVSEYMTQSPHTIDTQEPAAKAAAFMVRHRLRHLPVTEGGRLVGFLSARDLLRLTPWPRPLPVVEPW